MWVGGSHAIHEYSVADCSHRRLVGVGPLQFFCPLQVWIASDDFVFVADMSNDRVQVLTPCLDFQGFVGVGQLDGPAGVCVPTLTSSSCHSTSRTASACSAAATALFFVVLAVMAVLYFPSGVFSMSDDRYVARAVADSGNNRVSVFSIDGEFIRHVGVSVLKDPAGVVCSAFGELVVADRGNRRVVVFSADGEVSMTMGDGDFSGVTIHGGIVFAQECVRGMCTVFT
jgi:DNA-binding beta-propeller fold protein YncE